MKRKAAILSAVLAAYLVAFASLATAAPVHPLLEGRVLDGFNHACGIAVDSEGDIYVSSAGESKIRISDPEHNELTSIPNSNEPCGLAVDSQGNVYVLEKATGEVVKYEPTEYPFTGSPSYGPRTPIDSSGKAKGIAVDPFDDRLYVAEGNRIEVYESNGTSAAVSEVQNITFFSPTSGTFRLAMPAEGAASRNEIQWVRRANNASGSGTFTLTFEEQTTAPIPQEATAAEVKAALETLSTIGSGNVSVTGYPGVRGYWVEFVGILAETDVALIEANGEALEDANKTILVDAYSDVTGSITLGATAAEVKPQLEGLDSIGAGNVEVEPSGSNYLVKFTGSLANTNVGQLAGDGTGLEGGSWRRIEGTTLIDGFSGHIAEGELTEATGVAPYTYTVEGSKVTRYLFVADANGAGPDKVEIFSGSDIRALKPRRTITAVDHDGDPETAPQQFGFGATGAYLAADPGTCPPAGQACAAGHFYLYDAANEALDEFEASGELLARIPSPDPPYAFEDAEPTAIAVDRSGGAGNGELYVTSGAGAEAKALAFKALPEPERSADEDLSLPAPGSPPEAPKLESICGVAVDEYGNRYVAAEKAIYVYSATGTMPLTTIAAPKRPCDLAVDSEGKVWAIERGESAAESRAVFYTPEVFPPVEGTKYSDPTVCLINGPPYLPTSAERLNSVGLDPRDDHAFVNRPDRTLELDAAEDECGVVNGDFASGLNQRADIAVYGANGNVYLLAGNQVKVLDEGGKETLATISGAGSPKGPFTFGFLATSIAVDQENGHVVYFSWPRGAVEEYEASGAFVAQFGAFESLDRASALAIDNGAESPNQGTLYLAYDDPALANPFNLAAFEALEYGQPPSVVTETANAIGEGKATLNGTVNPNGAELEDCHFEYLAEGDYEKNIEEAKPPFEGAQAAACVPGPAEIGKAKSPVAVGAEVGGLDLDQRHVFRLVAKNEFGAEAGKATLFGPPLITTKSALPSYTEASLRAAVDPSGLETECRFAYGTTEAYGSETDAQTVKADAGATELEAPIFALAEGTLYHFRALCANEAKAVAEPDQTFETLLRPEPSPECPNEEFRSGRSAGLPDCRAYELTTPADTRGASPVAPLVESGAQPFNNWLVAPRGEGAGESLAFTIPGTTLPGYDGNGRLDGYRSARLPGAHPEGGWQTELTAPSFAQAGGDQPTVWGIASDQRYWFWRVTPFEVFAGTLAPGKYLRTPAGFEILGQGSLAPFEDPDATPRYLSAGAGHVLFESDVRLEPGAPLSGTALYDRSPAGPTRVVSLKPGDEPFAAGEDAGYLGATEDGEAIAFAVGGALYVRRSGEETVKVAEAPNAFAGLSEDGERLFYAEQAAGPADLYAFELDSETTIPIATDSRFVNVSADGSAAYFTSKEQQEGKGVSNEDNLFRWDGTGIHFIAVLDPTDTALMSWTNVVSFGGRAADPSRSTPDGEVFVFESAARLTPYENEGFAEVYRYHAGEEAIACVSCDPSGAPPGGDAALQSPGGLNPTTSRTLIANLTDDGQAVFFETEDPLLPEDANRVRDVYEWKAPGAGTAGKCGLEGGCLALISSGRGDRDSFLYGMSADGRDVFFATLEQLHGADVVGGPSIYDARVEGGIPDPPAAEDCQGDACQGQGSAPPTLPAPTSTGSGSAPVGKPRCPKGKRRVVRRGKARCVKKHGKRPAAGQRRSAR